MGYRTAEELKGKADAKATDITARAYRLSGNMLESAVELMALSDLQDDPAQRLATQREILHTLALLSEADARLYEAKAAGRNRVI